MQAANIITTPTDKTENVQELKDEILKLKQQKSELQKQNEELQKIYKELQPVKVENEELKHEILKLKKQNLELQKQNDELQKKNKGRKIFNDSQKPGLTCKDLRLRLCTMCNGLALRKGTKSTQHLRTKIGQNNTLNCISA